MTIISERDQDMLRERFARELENEVTFRLFIQRETRLKVPGRNWMHCAETRMLLEELTALSDKLHLEVYDYVADREKMAEYGIERIPAFVMSAGAGASLRYYGIPAGFEFSAVLDDLRDLSRGENALSEQSLERLDTLDQDIHIQVFVTPT